MAVILSLLLALAGCGKRGGTSASESATVELTRVPGGDFSPFVVTLTARNGATPKSGLTVTITAAGAGATISTVTDHADGTYTATVTPANSGEVLVTATIASWHLTKKVTAVVLKHVANGWGQPTSVTGSVNTTGWEDSLNISADGQWLTLLYSPVSISGILHGDENHPWAKFVSGPYGGPLRPNFPRNRIAADGSVTYSYPLYFIADTGTPFPPPTATYGFHRQPDGSFAQPFLVSPDDSGNGCLGGFGACLVPTSDPQRPLCVFAFNTPCTVRVGDATDIVVAPIHLGHKNILGHYTVDPVTHIISSSDTPIVTLGIDTTGHQGNPCAYADLSNNVQSVWTDDETASEQSVSVQSLQSGGSFPAGPWGPKMTPPAPV
ncbi:MAG TPA: Ig-like domain-containing protein, partial [Planctomycetota bacterium]|nr:Ig-like domain-containing protein [Planctomycetota bacterium]